MPHLGLLCAPGDQPIMHTWVQGDWSLGLAVIPHQIELPAWLSSVLFLDWFPGFDLAWTQPVVLCSVSGLFLLPLVPWLGLESPSNAAGMLSLALDSLCAFATDYLLCRNLHFLDWSVYALPHLSCKVVVVPLNEGITWIWKMSYMRKEKKRKALNTIRSEGQCGCRMHG